MATRAVNFNRHGHRETRATSSQSSSASSGRERRRQGKRKMLDKIAALERRVCDLQHRDDESNARIAALTEQLSTSRRQQESLRGVITALQSSADHSGHAKPLEPQPLVFDLFTMETAEASVQTSISFHHQCADKFFTVGGDGRPAVLDLGATHSAADAAAGGLLATPAFALEQHGQAEFGIPPSASLDSSLLCAQRDGGGECAEMRVLGPQARKTPGGRVLAVSHCPVDTAIGATPSLDVAGTTTAEQNEPSLANSGSKGEGTSLTTPAGHIKANVPPASVGSQPSLTRAGAPGIVSARIRDKTRDALAQYEHPGTEAVASGAPDTPSYVSARIRDKARDAIESGPLQSHDLLVDTGGMHDTSSTSQDLANSDGSLLICASVERAQKLAAGSDSAFPGSEAVASEAADVGKIAADAAITGCDDVSDDNVLLDATTDNGGTNEQNLKDFNSHHLANVVEPLPICASSEQPAEQASPRAFDATADMGTHAHAHDGAASSSRLAQLEHLRLQFIDTLSSVTGDPEPLHRGIALIEEEIELEAAKSSPVNAHVAVGIPASAFSTRQCGPDDSEFDTSALVEGTNSQTLANSGHFHAIATEDFNSHCQEGSGLLQCGPLPLQSAVSQNLANTCGEASAQHAPPVLFEEIPESNDSHSWSEPQQTQPVLLEAAAQHPVGSPEAIQECMRQLQISFTAMQQQQAIVSQYMRQ